jgi:hypothetical protein
MSAEPRVRRIELANLAEWSISPFWLSSFLAQRQHDLSWVADAPAGVLFFPPWLLRLRWCAGFLFFSLLAPVRWAVVAVLPDE